MIINLSPYYQQYALYHINNDKNNNYNKFEYVLNDSTLEVTVKI